MLAEIMKENQLCPIISYSALERLNGSEQTLSLKAGSYFMKSQKLSADLYHSSLDEMHTHLRLTCLSPCTTWLLE